MPDPFILSDAGFDSTPSERTMRGRTTPRGERLRAGDVLLGRYTVLSELGEGGMGVVYKCLDKVGGIEVALKCLPPELSRNEAEMEGIRENYAIVAKLHHSAISGLRQLEKDPDFGEYYLVMDLAEGEDLSALLRRRHGAPMPPAEALAILRPLASALDYAHGEKVLHRDVKPANVKVAFPGGASRPGEPRVQLLDFGLAAEVRSSMSRVSLRGHAGSSGTPSYMAPEQWEARRQSAATDQYALAVMAYQMLSGALPFDADDTDLLRRAVLSRAPDPVPGLSRAANAALLRALAKDPAGRFPSCTAFVEALRLAGTARPTRRRFILAAALLAVAAGLFLTQSRVGGGPGEAEPPPVDSRAETSEDSETANSETRNPNPAAEGRQDDGTTGRQEIEPLPPAGREASPRLALPPDGASVADLRIARTRALDALDARRERFEPDDSPDSAAFLAAVSTLDARIAAALEAEESAARKAEEDRLAARAADARAVAQMARLKAAAVRQERAVQPYRKWNDGEFKIQFAALDAAKSALDALSEASDLPAAKDRSAEIVAAAAWIEENAAAREEIDAIERSLDARRGDLASAEAGTYAKAKLGAAETARSDAARLRDKGRFPEAKAKFEESRRLYDEALAAASAARAAAKAREAVALAEAAKIREDWDAVLAQAGEALRYEPANASALALKREAEAERKKIADAQAAAEAAKRKAEEEARRLSRRTQGGGGLQSAVGQSGGGLETAAPLAGAREAGARIAVRENRGHGKVQLWEGGPYWAETNIGADKPEDSGLYFWWGDTVGYRREGDAWVASDGSSRSFSFSQGNVPTCGKDDATLRREGWITGSRVLAPEHDAAHVHWGGDWRMPTNQELDDLDRKCDWTWTTRNGVKGYVVKGRGAYASASIFLPAAGYGRGSSLNDAGSYGGYWSSVPGGSHSYYAWYLDFYSGDRRTRNYDRDYGQSVRPVQGFAK